jgi:hypothetical protein
MPRHETVVAFLSASTATVPAHFLDWETGLELFIMRDSVDLMHQIVVAKSTDEHATLYKVLYEFDEDGDSSDNEQWFDGTLLLPPVVHSTVPFQDLLGKLKAGKVACHLFSPVLSSETEPATDDDFDLECSDVEE